MRYVHSYIENGRLAGYEIGYWKGARFHAEGRIAIAGRDRGDRMRAFRIAREIAAGLDRGGRHGEIARYRIGRG